CAGITPIHPQEAEPSKPSQHPPQNRLGAITFGRVGGRDHHAKHQAQSVHQHVTFPTLDSFARIIADGTAVSGGFDALAVQYARSRLAAPALVFPDQDPQGIIESRPLMTLLPAPEDTIDRLPRWEISGQIPPL